MEKLCLILVDQSHLNPIHSTFINQCMSKMSIIITLDWTCVEPWHTSKSSLDQVVNP